MSGAPGSSSCLVMSRPASGAAPNDSINPPVTNEAVTRIGSLVPDRFAPPFTQRLNLRSDLYTTGYLYNDVYTAGLAAAHGRLVEREPGAYRWGSSSLDNASSALYRAQAQRSGTRTIGERTAEAGGCLSTPSAHPRAARAAANGTRN